MNEGGVILRETTPISIKMDFPVNGQMDPINHFPLVTSVDVDACYTFVPLEMKTFNLQMLKHRAAVGLMFVFCGNSWTLLGVEPPGSVQGQSAEQEVSS